MKIFTGLLNGLTELPRAPWAAARRFTTVQIGEVVLRDLSAPRDLAALLANAEAGTPCTLYVRGRRIVGVGLFGHTYYCRPALPASALGWGLVAVVGVMLIPDANASTAMRVALACPFAVVGVVAGWTHWALRALRTRADAVPL